LAAVLSVHPQTLSPPTTPAQSSKSSQDQTISPKSIAVRNIDRFTIGGNISTSKPSNHLKYFYTFLQSLLPISISNAVDHPTNKKLHKDVVL